MKIQNSFICLAVAALSSSSALAAGKLNIPDEPLTVLSSRVDPNVMLVIDNSGSMNGAIWHEDYDPSTQPTSNYNSGDDWVYRNENGNWYYISNSSDYTIDNINRSNGWYQLGYYDGSISTVWVKLPDPVGNERTRYYGHYLKWILNTYNVSSGDDLRGTLPDGSTLPNEYRMEVARQVSSEIVSEVEGVRFGAAKFYTNDGGKIIKGCGPSQITPSNSQWTAHKDDLIDEINDLNATTNTPVSETYYEVTRYFRGA